MYSSNFQLEKLFVNLKHIILVRGDFTPALEQMGFELAFTTSLSNGKTKSEQSKSSPTEFIKYPDLDCRFENINQDTTAHHFKFALSTTIDGIREKDDKTRLSNDQQFEEYN